MKKYIFSFMLFIGIAFLNIPNNNLSAQTIDPSQYSIVTSPNVNTLSLCSQYRFSLSGPALPSNAYISWSVSANLKIKESPNNETLLAKKIETGWTTVTARIMYYGREYSVERSFMERDFLIDHRINYSTSGSEILRNRASFTGTITINTGHTMTINNIVNCTPSTKIIVRPGGKLVIDGGKLTSFCSDELWQGIVVMGTRSNTNQNETTQGVVEIKNGGTIEHAITGIKTGESYSYGGGIIKAEDAVFLNNQCAVEFRSYKNMPGGTELDNLSYFTRCSFTLNDMNNLYKNGYVFENGMVKLEGVKGIKFKGCKFLNSVTPQRVNNPKRGKGIHSVNSGFYVDYYCRYEWHTTDGCRGCSGGLIKSEFEGFEYGIYATGSSHTSSVWSSVFTNNYYSIYAGSVPNFRIYMSEFNLQYPAYESIPDASAIRLEGCPEFKIEANTITNHSGINRGIYVINCGTNDSKIYRNTFTDLYRGIEVVGNNGGSTTTGLRFECNKFNFVSALTTIHDIFINPTATVCKTQGSANSCANNEFVSGIYNQNPNNIITYYYCDASKERFRDSNMIFRPGGANSCPQTICGRSYVIIGPIELDPFGNNDPLNSYTAMNEIYSSNFEEFNTSGYANILKEFEAGEGNESMRYMYNEALALENEMNLLNSRMSSLSSENISGLLDSEETDIKKLQSWYKAVNGLGEKYSLVESYRDHGDYSSASSLLSEIPYMFELEEEGYENYLNYVDLNNFRDNILTSGRYFDELTEDEISALQAIAGKEAGHSSILAYGILCYYYNLCPEGRETEEYIPEFFADKRSVLNEEGNISLFPNPASEEVTVTSETLINKLIVIDFLGKNILEQNKVNAYSVKLNVKELSAGVYFVEIHTEEGISKIKFIKE